jgi:hypothetical protein
MSSVDEVAARDCGAEPMTNIPPSRAKPRILENLAICIPYAAVFPRLRGASLAVTAASINNQANQHRAEPLAASGRDSRKSSQGTLQRLPGRYVAERPRLLK